MSMDLRSLSDVPSGCGRVGCFCELGLHSIFVSSNIELVVESTELLQSKSDIKGMESLLGS